jgi:hypothetical protein
MYKNIVYRPLSFGSLSIVMYWPGLQRVVFLVRVLFIACCILHMESRFSKNELRIINKRISLIKKGRAKEHLEIHCLIKMKDKIDCNLKLFSNYLKNLLYRKIN